MWFDQIIYILHIELLIIKLTVLDYFTFTCLLGSYYLLIIFCCLLTAQDHFMIKVVLESESWAHLTKAFRLPIRRRFESWLPNQLGILHWKSRRYFWLRFLWIKTSAFSFNFTRYMTTFCWTEVLNMLQISRNSTSWPSLINSFSALARQTLSQFLFFSCFRHLCTFLFVWLNVHRGKFESPTQLFSDQIVRVNICIWH